MKVDGAWTAIVTPLDTEGAIDWAGLERNIEFQIAQGITGVVPVGTTGESPTLGWDEHNEVVDKAIDLCVDRCAILAGTGSNSTAEAIGLTRHAIRSGAKAILLVDCYYNGPSSAELRDHYYSRVAAQFPGVTIVPYIIPGRSGTALSVEDLAILYDRHRNICAVKEATGDLGRMARTRELLGPEFSIMSGDDDVTFNMMTDPKIAADGVISVMSNVIPNGISSMVRLAAQGDTAGASELRDAMSPLLSAVTVKVDNARTLPDGSNAIVNDRYRNPVPIKTLMNGLGMAAGLCRSPLGSMSPAGVRVVRSAASRVWQTNPELLAPIGDFYGVDVEARLADDRIWSSLCE